MKKTRLLLSATTFSAMAMLLDSPANAEFYRTVGDWAIASTGDESCGMIREYEHVGKTTTLYLGKEISGQTTMSVSNPDWTSIKGLKYKIAYFLNDSTYTGESLAIGGGFAIEANEDFMRDFAAAKSLYMTLDNQVVDHLSLGGSSQALKYLDQCIQKITADFGRLVEEKNKFNYIANDPFVSAKPIRPSNPTPISAMTSWASPSDYPSKALAEGREGIVSFRLTIDIQGKILDCVIVETSGHADLDAATCSSILRRAKFTPAIDVYGNAVVGSYSQSQRWKVPK